MKKKLALISILLLIVIPVAVVWSIGTSLTDSVNTLIGEPPKDIPLNAVQFSSKSGAKIHGWFANGVDGKGVIILMHGVQANRLVMLDRARFLNKNGYSVLLFDFQAHGESIGEHITFGYLESRDAQAAVEFVRSKLPQEKIGVIGVSMGGAAFLLAQPKLDVDAAVLEMVYPAIEQATSNRLKLYLGNWAGIFTPLLTWQLKPRLGIGVNDLRPIDCAGLITIPKLFIAGEKDEHTTLEESETLFKAASKPKELWIIPNAKHTDAYALTKAEYEQRVLSFFEKNLQNNAN